MLRISPLTDSTLPRTFDCGNATNYRDLADFLLNDALNYQTGLVGQTSLVYVDSDLVGYFTLCCSEIQLQPRERMSFLHREGLRIPIFPAVKLARLAIQEDFQGMGIGTLIVYSTIGMAISLNRQRDDTKIGCRFVLVDAIPESEGFYANLGFEENRLQERDHTKSYRLDILSDISDKVSEAAESIITESPQLKLFPQNNN